MNFTDKRIKYFQLDFFKYFVYNIVGFGNDDFGQLPKEPKYSIRLFIKSKSERLLQHKNYSIKNKEKMQCSSSSGTCEMIFFQIAVAKACFGIAVANV